MDDKTFKRTDGKKPFVRIRLKITSSLERKIAAESQNGQRVVESGFFIKCRKDCRLSAKDFEESVAAKSMLRNMFFEKSHLEIRLCKDHAVIIARDAMDCVLTGPLKEEQMEIDEEYRLSNGIEYVLKIDTVEYYIEARGFV
jgi:hypothetical protein